MSKTLELVKTLYKDEQGTPLVLTPGQVELFELIFQRLYPRNHVMALTRYGKSLTVALAVLTRVSTFAEKWAIVAPSEKKAKIIMSYIIDHVFDNDYTKSKLDIGKDESLEHLRRERSKSRLVFKHADGTFGEVYILSADSRNKLKAGDSLMGFGAANLILDEAALIDDDIEAKIFRMLGDKIENYYFKIGNPFNRNHFLDSYRDPKYHKVNIDYKQALREGRVTEEFISEAKKKPHFPVLYENIFPSEMAIDDKGWSYLITEEEYNHGRTVIEKEGWFGERTLGVDVARGGGNFNAWVLRTKNYAKLLAKNQDDDLMSVAGATIRLAKEYGVKANNIFIDDTGVGAGVYDRLREVNWGVNSVMLGSKPDNEEAYLNRRAESYWRLKQWLNTGGKLCAEDNFSELLDIKYKADSAGRIKIMPKDLMRKYGIESPDVADALMLTFDKPAFGSIRLIEAPDSSPIRLIQ